VNDRDIKVLLVHQVSEPVCDCPALSITFLTKEEKGVVLI
jgi:hypothetical protein